MAKLSGRILFLHPYIPGEAGLRGHGGEAGGRQQGQHPQRRHLRGGGHQQQQHPASEVIQLISAANRSIGSTTGCTITEKASTKAFSWLKAPTSAFTFKTLLRHYAKQPPVPYD